MPRHAQIEPAISRLLDAQRGVDTDAIARAVYHLDPHQHPTPSQRAAVTRGMRGFVRNHEDYVLVDGRGRAALFIIRVNARTKR
jgi:hypothetical protein